MSLSTWNSHSPSVRCSTHITGDVWNSNEVVHLCCSALPPCCVSGDRKILICNKAHTNAGGYERTLKMLAAWWLILDSVIFLIQLLDTFQSLGVTETYLEEVISTSSFSIVLEILYVRYKNVTLLSIMKPYYENEHKVHNQSRLPRLPLFW